MSRFRAVITDADYPDVPQERAILQAIDAELVWANLRTEDDLIRGLAGADVILTQYARLTARVIETLDRCRGIVRYGVGYDTVDLDAATRKGIYVCNVPDYGTDEVSDHAITMLLVIARKVIPLAQGVQLGIWSVEHVKPVYRLRGRTVGIVGLGWIGAPAAGPRGGGAAAAWRAAALPGQPPPCSRPTLAAPTASRYPHPWTVQSHRRSP